MTDEPKVWEEEQLPHASKHMHIVGEMPARIVVLLREVIDKGGDLLRPGECARPPDQEIIAHPVLPLTLAQRLRIPAEEHRKGKEPSTFDSLEAAAPEVEP